MNLVGRKQLLEFVRKHADARNWIATWLAETKAANWRTSKDIKARYRSASFLAENVVIFNVKGNRYRLEVQVSYGLGVVMVRHIETHADYTRRISRGR